MTPAPERSFELHSLIVPRHARVGLLGDVTTAHHAWLLLHGYGMLAQGFLHWFRAARHADRLLVAPEALSRFYQERPTGRVVGATWMTREDREHEITDQGSYLDSVYATWLASLPRWEIHAFSQGVATAFRWVARGGPMPGRLVCWGGHSPPDLDIDAFVRTFGSRPVLFVIGTRDKYVDHQAVVADSERLREAGALVEVRTFDGGHRIDDAVLAELSGAAGSLEAQSPTS